MRQQNGARACCQLALHQRACGAFVCSLWSAHSGCSELSSRFWYTRSFNIQPAKKHSFCRYCVISWGRFSTKKTLSNPSSPAGRSTFLSCGSFHQIGEHWILLLHSFAEIKMMGKKQGKIKIYLLLFLKNISDYIYYSLPAKIDLFGEKILLIIVLFSSILFNL